jgi:arabinose-5-phosphate isomerase
MHKGDEIPLILSGSTFKQAIFIISEKRHGCVGIVDKAGNILGVFTDGDLRRHIDYDINTTIIDDIMTIKPVLLSADIFASEALKKMNQMQITSFFIAEAAKPLGIIHMHDIIRAKVA